MLTYLLKKWLFYLWMLIPVSIFAEADNQYSNPVIGLNYSTADVCVWEKSGTYYLFHTTYFNHMHILESQNLVDWKDSKIDVFDNEILNLFQGYLNKHGIKDCFGGCKSIWAPHVVKIKNKWNIYFSLSNKGGIHVLQANSPTGPFKFVGDPKALVDHKMMGWEYDAIDPFVIEDEGKLWLFFGSSFGVYRHQLTDDGLNLAPNDSFTLVAGPTDPAQKVDGENHGGYEGVFLYKHDGYWYCIVSKRLDYSLYVGRSKTLTGDFIDMDGRRLIDGYGTRMNYPTEKFPGPGHNGEIFKDSTGHYYIFYQVWTLDKNGHYDMRKTILSELVWENGFPHVLDYKLKETGNRKPVFQ
jgi:arabinan endo-1,5-alpha-L-arabinosidase